MRQRRFGSYPKKRFLYWYFPYLVLFVYIGYAGYVFFAEPLWDGTLHHAVELALPMSSILFALSVAAMLHAEDRGLVRVWWGALFVAVLTFASMCVEIFWLAMHQPII